MSAVKLSVLLAALLTANRVSATAPSFIQSANARGCGSSSLTATFPVSTQPGRCIVVAAGSVCLSGLPVVSSVSDGSATYTKRVSQTNVFEDVEFWTTSAAGSGSITQVTVNFDSTCANSPVFAAILEYNNVGAIGATNSTTGSGNVSVDITSGVANTRCLAAVCPGGSCTLSGASDTERINLIDPSCSGVAGAFGVQDVSLASASTHSFTWTEGGCGWPAVTLELQPSSTTETFTVTATGTSTATATSSPTSSATRTATATPSATATATRTFTTSPTANPDPAPCNQVWYSAETGLHGGPQVIDSLSNTIIATPKGGTGIGGAGDNLSLWFSPNGQSVVGQYYENENLTKFGVAPPAPVATITEDFGTHGAVVAPNSSRAYFANRQTQNIFVVDVPSWTVVATVSAANIGDSGITVSKDNTRLWNDADTGSVPNRILVYDTSTFAVVATISTPNGGFDNAMVLTPNGSFVYHTNNGSSSVSVIDTSSYTIVATISGLQLFPAGVAVAPNGSRAYVSTLTGSPTSGTIYTINTATNVVIATVATGFALHGIFTTADNSYLWVTDYGCGDSCVPARVVKYDVSNWTIVSDINSGDSSAASSNSFAVLQAPLCPVVGGRSPNKQGCR